MLVCESQFRDFNLDFPICYVITYWVRSMRGADTPARNPAMYLRDTSLTMQFATMNMIKLLSNENDIDSHRYEISATFKHSNH